MPISFFNKSKPFSFLVTISVFVSIYVLPFSCSLEFQRIKHVPKSHASLSFLAVGDWGRGGNYNQTQVAHQMGNIGQKLNIDFVISTGDNFYNKGLKNVHDPAFRDSFSKIYTSPSLQKPWYAVLGNHDYMGNVSAQLSPVLKKLDRRWNCHRSFILDTGIVDIFFVDTNPMVDSYFSDKGHVYDWTGVLPRPQYISRVLSELDMSLKKSVAKWKLVVGHHPIKSAGYHGSTKELETHLLPILLKNNVVLYINGHDHCLEHISSPKGEIQFLTSGGGSKAWKGDSKRWKRSETKMYYDGQGFMSLQLSSTDLRLAFYDVFGRVLHQWNTAKQSHHSI